MADTGLPVSNAFFSVNSFAVSGSNVFAGTNNAGVFLSTNNGTSWTPVNSGLTNVTILSLMVSGGNIFAGTNGGAYISPNNGTSWSAIDSGLSNVNSITSFTANGKNIFAETNNGVYLSTNNGTYWTQFNSGLPTNSSVSSLMVSGDNIFAGTKSTGIWRRPLSETSVINSDQQSGIFNQVNFKIFSKNHSATSNVSIEFTLFHSDQIAVKIYNLSGREITTLVNKKFGAGEHCLCWNTRNIAPGCYTIRMQAGANSYEKSLPIF